MTDKAIAWVRQQKSLMPDKPFFMYYAPGATHAPHHVPKEWSDKYKGAVRPTAGTRCARRSSPARRSSASCPPDAELTARHEEIPAWDDMPDELKPVLARQMEVYAGFLEHTDHHVGRLVDALEDLGVLEDTLVYYIIGDNGASAEGTINGTFNEMFIFNGADALETPEFVAAHIDEFGTPTAYNHYAVGWAHAMDTPYQWTKQVASHWGGTRNGTIVHWPQRLRGARARSARSSTTSSTSRRPCSRPRASRSRPLSTASSSMPMRGREHALLVRRRRPQPSAARRSTSRCSATAASTTRAGPRSPGTRRRGSWQRCRPSTTTSGSSTTRRRTGARRTTSPPRCRRSSRELQQLWLDEARKYNVLPLDDRRIERFNPDLAGRPTLIKGNTQMLFGGMGRLTENSSSTSRTSRTPSRPRSTSPTRAPRA